MGPTHAPHTPRRQTLDQCRAPGSASRRWRDAGAELVALQAEYAAWLDALPETLRDGATGEALQRIVELDRDELLAIDPPRGYGRD
jgi:hypothetical protein